MAPYRPHDYEKDVDSITLLDRKNKLEEAEAYNSPETIARKRRAVKAARRLSARQLSTSTDYASSSSNLALRPRVAHADGRSLDFDDAMSRTQSNDVVLVEVTTSAEKTKKKNRRRNRPRVNSIAADARQKAQKVVGEAHLVEGALKRKAEVVEDSTPLSTPQRQSARIKGAKTQQERDEELIASQLETV